MDLIVSGLALKKMGYGSVNDFCIRNKSCNVDFFAYSILQDLLANDYRIANRPRLALAISIMSEQSNTSNPSACGLPSNADIGGEGRLNRTEAEWKEILSPERYRVLRAQGTEPPFQNEFWNHKASGAYECAGCGETLFESETKFDSGTGWPSFFRPAQSDSVDETVDESHGMVRTEVHCSNCGGHLGHVFPDGPKPTGQRYCINSASLTFSPGEAI